MCMWFCVCIRFYTLIFHKHQYFKRISRSSAKSFYLESETQKKLYNIIKSKIFQRLPHCLVTVILGYCQSLRVYRKTLIETVISVVLAVGVGVLGAMLLTHQFYVDFWIFVLCFVMASCQYSLLKVSIGDRLRINIYHILVHRWVGKYVKCSAKSYNLTWSYHVRTDKTHSLLGDCPKPHVYKESWIWALLCELRWPRS